VKRVAGVDGARGGWVAIVAELDGRPRELRFVEKLADLVKTGEFDLIAIDMPMGFLDRAVKGGRDCEQAARAALPGKSSSVFSAPCRPALSAKDYPTALKRNRAANGIGLSKQAFNLFPKMRELDALLRAGPKCRIVEAHPEFGFARLAGAPVLEPKRKTEGRQRRLALLAKHGMKDIADWLDLLPRSIAAPDDVIDAAMVCLAALRIVAGKGECLPKKAPKDRFGIEMGIWR
jgi:predicted RNase H-like nuclease